MNCTDYIGMKTISASKLQRLSFCNSPDIPPIVRFLETSGSAAPFHYIYKEWIGIGWIEVNEPANAEEIPVVIYE